MKKSFFSKQSWKKQLAVAVTAGLMTGMYMPASLAAEYNQGLSADFEGTSDAEWLGTDIVNVGMDDYGSPIVKYSFKGDNSFNIEGTNSATAISIIDDPTVIIDVADGGTLKLNSSASTSGSNASAAGLSIAAADGVGANVTVNGNMDIQAHSQSAFASGISMGISGSGDGGEAHLTINGDVTMRNKDNVDNPWGITSANIHGGYGPDGWAGDDGWGGADYTGARWAPAGISLGSGYGSTIDINGNVDLAVAGSAIVTNNYYDGDGTINLNGGSVIIDTPESTTETYYALANYGGTINVNMNGEQAGTNDVNITGNIISMKNSSGSGEPYFYENGQINLAIATADSSWTGVIDNSGAAQAGEVNLYLQNGASWQHESLSKTNGMQVENMPNPSNDHYGVYDKVSHVASLNGGSDAQKAGYIFQNDGAKIAVDNYSGHTVVVYKHENTGDSAGDYKAGDITINKAAAASGITLSTDSSGITMTDSDLVSRVLDTLAGKLTYSAYTSGEKNLSGKVQIADGLTSSSAAKKVGDITFNETTGKGGYVSEGQPELPTYSQTLTGDTEADTEYADIIKDGKYVFAENSVIEVAGKAAIDAKKQLTVDAGDKTLDLKVSGTGGDLAGIKADLGMWSGGKLNNTISAGKLNITVENTGDGTVTGIKNSENTLTVNSDVVINALGQKNVSGITSDYLGTTVNGDVDITAAASGSGSSAYGVAVKYGGSFKAENANIDVTTGGSGAALKATYGYSNGQNGEGKSIIDIGSGTIKINSDGTEPVYAILVEKEDGRTTQEVYINKDAAAKKVDIHGNIKLTGNNSDLTLGLATEDSKLNGVIFSKEYEEISWEGWKPVTKIDTPDVFLTLKNGAVWNNEVQGSIDQDFKGSYVSDFTGGSSASEAGYILQKDGRKLTLENYSGHSVIVYEHTDNGTSAEHYAAGDTIIKNAAADSGIVLSTGSNGIAMNDEKEVTRVLNTLAGKLTYESFTSGEKNLTGKVQIADGLTSSSASMKIGDIVFDSDTGKGGYGDLNQTTKDFTAQLTGDGNDTAYKEAHVIQEDGSYKFMKDSSIAMGDGTPAVDVKGDVVIDAAGSSLTLKSEGTGDVYGISQSSANKAEITADKLNITATSTTRAEGIHMANGNSDIQPELTINGDVEISAAGKENTIGAYVQGNSILNINGDVKMTIDGNNGGWGYYGASGLYATSNMGANSMGATINVDGNVDIKGNANGIFVNAGGSTVTVGGGRIEVDSSKNNYSAIRAENGVVNMNVQVDKNGKVTGAGTNDVNIKGNVAVTTGAVNGNDKNGTLSQVNLGLTTQGSTLNGVIYNAFPEEGKESGGLTFKGEANLWLQNGATWTNEVSGKMDKGFAGSTVENFTGGASADKAGNIFQKDSNKLTINNYSGYTNIYYAHDNAGAAAEDYKAGDTIVKNAAAGSGISMITDNSGIDMGNIDTVNSVLNALAGKLTYEGFVSGERNLAGKVQIADGLTASGASLKVEDIIFDETTGKGGYEAQTPDEEQSKAEFTETITGIRSENMDYVMSGVLKDDGRYVFTMEATVLPGISLGEKVEQDLEVDASGNILNMKHVGNGSAHKLDITAGTLNIENAVGAERVEGISTGSSEGIVINGNTNINVSGRSDYTLGVYTVGEGNVTFNGDVTMKGKDDNKWGVDDNGQGYGYYGSTALYAGSNYGIQKGGTINVNGNVDLVVNANGAFANGGGSTVNIDGGSIEVNSERQLYALIAQSGYINMNMNDAKDGAGANKVNIKGNLGVLNGSVNPNEPCKDSIINLGLSTKDSTWTGVIDNNFTKNQIADGWDGTVNLWLQNGATWTNEAYGKTDRKFSGSTVESFTGGASAEKAGNIFQKDSNKLTFNNYSGYTNIYYAHDNAGTAAEDYKAGDTIVKHAAAGSGISLITDNSGITMADKDQVSSVLNALAGKLTYEGFVSGEKNLTGKVQIADGLTSSSAALQTGNIAFDETTGKGGYVSEEQPEQPKTDFTTAITGVEATDTEYADTGIIQEDGSYKFDADTNINVDAGNAAEVNAGIKDTNGGLVIDAADHELNIAIKSTAGTLNGIVGKNDTVITADKVNINVDNQANRAQGIRGGGTINGDVNINVHGKGYALGTYVEDGSVLTINGNLTMKGEDGSWGVVDRDGGSSYNVNGIYAGALYGAGSAVNVNGDVDLAINGTGVHANCGGAVINLNGGGNILINKEHQKIHYSLASENGTINMNVVKDGDGKVTGAGDKTVNISGNLGLLAGAVHPNDPNKISYINLGLTTSDSVLNGVIVNTFTDTHKEQGYDGHANIYLQNGATWNNEAYGTTSSKFTGSTVENFTGGASADKAGNIFQKDSNKLTINNYSGYTNIYYAHDNAGAAAEDYKAGDTIVKNAAEGSGISLITDNSGIDMKSTEAIEATLSALAQKLTYEAYKEGEKNLSGKVQIAGGLTASSAALQVGDIEFAADGKGGYVEGSVTPGVSGDVEIGNYESDIMKGARSAMMTSMLSWRDNAADIYSRGAAVRDGAEEGAWARTFGGKEKYDGSSTSMENSYWAGQVGYDRTLANGWTLGAAIDYRDGNATYLNGGEGDNKLYSFGVYASKDLGGNAYLDVAAKAGKVENEYNVYNIIGTELDGDYSTRGYSLSAQYSKRFGDTAKGYVEPQLQLTWAHMDSESYNTHSGSNVMAINQDAFDSFVGRVGVKTGIETERGGLFAKLSLAHEFAGDVEGSYNANDGGLKTTKYDLGGTWSELTLGGSYKLSKCSNFYADITRSLSGDYQHQWKLNAGLNFSF